MSAPINIRSPRYLVAHTQGVCARCGELTGLAALVVPPGHEILEPGDDVPGDDVPGDDAPDDDAPGDEPSDNRTADDAADDAAADGDTPGVWSIASGSAFLFFIENIPDSVQRQLTVFAKAYRRTEDPGGDSPHWVNHCERCGWAFDDQELFGEPGGGFVPAREAEARLIRLVPIDAAIDATAGGYAYEPQFFDSMPRD